jgi:hypothetical protein
MGYFRKTSANATTKRKEKGQKIKKKIKTDPMKSYKNNTNEH